MNIINDPYSSRTAGVGQGITTALQGLLEGVAHGKAKELHQRNISRSLQPYGFSPEQAKAFSFLPPEIQKMAFEAQAGGSNADLFGGQQQPAAQQLLQQQPQNQFAQAREEGPQSQLSQALAYLKQQNPNLELTPQAGGENFLQNLQRQAPQQQSFMRALENPNETNFLDSLLKQAPGEAPEQKTAVTRQPNLGTAPIAPTRPTVDQLLDAANKTIGKRREHFLKLAQIESNREEKIKAHREKETKESRVEQREIEKKNKVYVDEVKTRAQAAEHFDKYLDRMTKLIDGGKLNSPAFHSTIKAAEKLIAPGIAGGLGALAGTAIGQPLAGAGAGAYAAKGVEVPLGWLQSPESQEFTKLSLEFLTKLKDIFGGRISNQEMENFMQSIPNLSMSDDGKKAVIRNMKLTGEAWKLKKQALNDIIKRNKGKQPDNIDTLVEKRIEPQMNKLSERFVEGS